jgi:eukaryotic-like serine/threonine-protein kinase
VKLRLAASPPEARMFLDEAQLPSNPFEGTLPRDGARHRVRVEAEGFVSRVEDVTLDHDWTLDLELAGAPVDGAARPASIQGAPTSPAGAGHVRGKAHRLDARNPYADLE